MGRGKAYVFKWMGFLMILSGTTGFGFCMSREYADRVVHLLELKKMVQYLIGQIGYEKATLPEAFLQTSKRVSEPFCSFLVTLTERLETEKGVRLGQHWNTCAKNLSAVLWQEDVEALGELMGQSGFADVSMQRLALENYQHVLEEKIAQLEGQRAEKCKIYQTLGLMSGVFLVLVLW